MRFWLFVLGGVCLVFFQALLPVSSVDAADGRILFRISLDNQPSHIQVQAVRRFATALQEKFGDRLNVELYDSARLFRDCDVFGALVEGKIEMAVPGTWHLAKYEPGVNVFLLPLFYGRSAEENHAVLAGTVGRELNRRIQDSLGVVVPGKWLDLGYANLYMLQRKVRTLDELRHLKIRVAGGRANALRIQAMGAKSVIVPWPDLPLWLDRKKIDGVLTTYETIRSAELWKHGLRFCLEDREFFPMYVPLISSRIWRLLPENIRRDIRTLWDATALWEREQAAIAQQSAKSEAEKHGMEVFVPKPDQIQAWRKELTAHQQQIMAQVGVDEELYRQAAAILNQ